jgi:hypothetical protein
MKLSFDTKVADNLVPVHGPGCFAEYFVFIRRKTMMNIAILCIMEEESALGDTSLH